MNLISTVIKVLLSNDLIFTLVIYTYFAFSCKKNIFLIINSYKMEQKRKLITVDMSQFSKNINKCMIISLFPWKLNALKCIK